MHTLDIRFAGAEISTGRAIRLRSLYCTPAGAARGEWRPPRLPLFPWRATDLDKMVLASVEMVLSSGPPRHLWLAGRRCRRRRIRKRSCGSGRGTSTTPWSPAPAPRGPLAAGGRSAPRCGSGSKSRPRRRRGRGSAHRPHEAPNVPARVGEDGDAPRLVDQPDRLLRGRPGPGTERLRAGHQVLLEEAEVAWSRRPPGDVGAARARLPPPDASFFVTPRRGASRRSLRPASPARAGPLAGGGDRAEVEP